MAGSHNLRSSDRKVPLGATRHRRINDCLQCGAEELKLGKIDPAIHVTLTVRG